MKSASPLLLSLALLSVPSFAQEATPAPAAADAPAADSTTQTAAAAQDAPAPTADTPKPAAGSVVATGADAESLDPKVLAAVGKPSPGKAMVVFFRPGKFMGGGVGFIVREKDVELGKLRNSRYFAIEVDPGQHQYVVHSEAKDVTDIETEAGETYFLSGTMTMGVMLYHPNLSPSDANAFQAALPKLKKSAPLG